MRQLLLLCSITLLSTTASIGQTNYHHNVPWGRLVLTDTINARLRWEMIVQHRWQNTPDSDLDAFRAPQVTAYWPWLHYTATPTTKISVTPMAYFETWPLIGSPADLTKARVREFRSSIRLDQEQKLGWLNLMNRYSVEPRWRDLDHDNVFKFNWRLRYMLRLEKPIRASWLKRPFALVVSDEVFVQFGPAVRGNPNVFDQNRIYVGFNTGVTRHIKASLGYLHWIQERPSGKEFDYSNVLWGVLTFDNLLSQFRKKR